MRTYVQEIEKCEDCPYFTEGENKTYCSRVSTPSIKVGVSSDNIPKWCPLPTEKTGDKKVEQGYDKVFIRKDFNPASTIS
ncbi:MAG: hypothetical protein K9L61_06105 [Candidatus Omnitrophica bacterium]|nr:hypothetical protein [Candidatus Omnitrophota bacterium]